jgi:hypothetical protein
MKAKIDTEKYYKFPENKGVFRKDHYYLVLDGETIVSYEGNPPQNAGEATYYSIIDERGYEIIVGQGAVYEFVNE